MQLGKAKANVQNEDDLSINCHAAAIDGELFTTGPSNMTLPGETQCCNTAALKDIHDDEKVMMVHGIYRMTTNYHIMGSKRNSPHVAPKTLKYLWDRHIKRHHKIWCLCSIMNLGGMPKNCHLPLQCCKARAKSKRNVNEVPKKRPWWRWALKLTNTMRLRPGSVSGDVKLGYHSKRYVKQAKMPGTAKMEVRLTMLFRPAER